MAGAAIGRSSARPAGIGARTGNVPSVSSASVPGRVGASRQLGSGISWNTCVERRVGQDHAIDDRLAVLRFTDLEIKIFIGRLDEIAGTVDVEQAHRFAGDLTAE